MAPDFANRAAIFKIALQVSSQYFGAVAGLLTAPHRARSGDRPELPQVFEKIPLQLFLLAPLNWNAPPPGTQTGVNAAANRAKDEDGQTAFQQMR